MHEFSIAEALAGQVSRHVPPAGRVLEVEIRVGALRAIEPEALRMCWEAVTHGTPLGGSSLVVDSRPWRLACGTCGRTWDSAVPFAACECGESAPVPTAGDELDLVSLTIDDGTPEPAGEIADPAAPGDAAAPAEAGTAAGGAS